MKITILFTMLLILTACHSDNQDIQREEEDSYSQRDIHPGNDILPNDIRSRDSED